MNISNKSRLLGVLKESELNTTFLYSANWESNKYGEKWLSVSVLDVWQNGKNETE